MPYITPEYFENTYKGKTPDDPKELEIAIMRASDTIDLITGYKIKDFETLHSFVKTQVEKATARLVDHYIMNGGYEVVANSDEVSSVGIGSFSYSASAKTEIEKKIPNEIFDMLSHTGLLYSGVDVNGYC